MLSVASLSQFLSAIASACAFLAGSAALAAPLKVDINNNGRPLAEGLDPGFTSWSPLTTWFPGGNTISATFTDVTITFTRVGSVGTALEPGYWKEGVQSTAYNIKLTADGIKVKDGDPGAQIEMKIAGLTTGSHTLLLYLNSWDGPTSVAPLDISVNGTQVVDNLPVSVRVTDNNNAATAYLTLTATAGQDVVVLIKAETSGAETTKNVHINGFEIDVPNTKAQANTPLPVHADEHVDADSGSLTLNWSSAVLGAASHNVYFGTSESAVTDATTASPEFKGNRATTTFPVSGINPHLTYFWRIDEIAANGVTTKGTVWYFRPRRLAFPGAEGYGRFARGGRGGVVVHVTNLNDSGPGSLRDAVEGNYGPRTVVFDVSGLITLQDDIVISGNQPYITIAGQTAPGKGITVKRQQFAMSGARDVIFRFVRVLVGKESGETQNATGMAGVDHCIMDHCSFGWGLDEGLSTRSGKNLTFQWCSLSEALNIAGHQNYPAGTEHGYAASIGGDVGSFHHNLLAHNEGRNWSMAGGLDAAGYYSGRLDLFNNVVYNWGGRTTDGGAMEVNFVNNYYKSGASTTRLTILNPQYGGFPGKQQYYMAGNVMPGRFNESNQAAGRTVGTESGGTIPEASNPPYTAWVNAPFFPSYATIDTATGAYKKILSDVGCNQPQIDNRDLRIINETLNGTTTYTGSVSGKRGLPDTTNDVGGWEDYGNSSRPATWDTDQDGLPDWWEILKGLNPNSPAGSFADSNADPDGDGYTHLEDYLNWMALPRVECARNGSAQFDLSKLTRGYTKSPVHSVSNPTNGTVTLLADGKTAQFTPSASYTGLAQFQLTVSDSDGDTMTRTVAIRVDKVIGEGYEIASNIAHPNGNIFDQVLLTGPNATFTADPGQVVRLSYVDLTNDIVQVEFAGPGSVSISLANASGPAAPVKYNQTVGYMKGHAAITVDGATENTYLSVFTVGSITAVNQALFKAGEIYDGVADIASITINSPTGRFGAIRCANTEFFATAGNTGIYAPGVRVAGPLNIHNISASDQATPFILTGPIDSGQVGITGGNMAQLNNRAVQIDGVTKIAMLAGATSHGVPQPAQINQARYERNGQDVTSQVVQNP